MSLGPILARPCEANAYHDDYIKRVADSFARVTGTTLPECSGPGAWRGDFALLTHRGDADAILNYGNAFALHLWEASWEEFTVTPSAATAPPGDHGPRDAMMKKVARDNFVHGYCGRRISRKGRLFIIADVTIWRLLDDKLEPFGVGAFFKTVR